MRIWTTALNLWVAELCSSFSMFFFAGGQEKGQRIASATYLKNFLRTHWTEGKLLSPQERLEFRNQLVEVLLRVDGLVLKLLAEAVCPFASINFRVELIESYEDGGWNPSLSLPLSHVQLAQLLDRLLITQLTCEMGFLVAVPFGGSSWFRKAKELVWACACTQNCHSQQWLGYCSSTIWVQDSECTYCPANNHQTISGSWLPFTLLPSAFPMQIKHFSCRFLLWWKRVCYQ